MPHAANKMSQEFFEHFIHTEVSRHPSLSAALQSKSNLHKCSQQFERAVTELHYRLIKEAVQQLFSRVSTARLQELSSAASSTCETKYVITESSPNTLSSQATDNEHFSSRWDAQSNNSQGLRQAPRSPPRSQVIYGQQKNNDQGGSRWIKAEDAHNHYQQQRNQPCQNPPPSLHQPCQPLPQQPCQPLPQQPCQPLPQQPCQPLPQQPCQQLQRQPCQPTQQPCQPLKRQPCQPQPQRPAAACAQPLQSASMTATTQLPLKPPRPEPLTREGPTCNYPTANHHNRSAMSGWYVANMDALLSNLMRLFEMIYRDTLQMCGVGACDLRQLRNALPDPTLISMQQRASGAWRPNFMNCKIDFLLHIASMVYRNTQDIRCGCPCSIPTDPCWPPRSDNQPGYQPPPKQMGTQVASKYRVNACNAGAQGTQVASNCRVNACNAGAQGSQVASTCLVNTCNAGAQGTQVASNCRVNACNAGAQGTQVASNCRINACNAGAQGSQVASRCRVNDCNVGVSWMPGQGGTEANRNNHTACECQCQPITLSPISPLLSPSPPPSSSRTFDGWDNNSNNAKSTSGCERQQKLDRRQRHLQRTVGRSSATVLSSSFSCSPSTTSGSQCSSRSSSSNSSAADTDTGNTCLSVSIKVPL